MARRSPHPAHGGPHPLGALLVGLGGVAGAAAREAVEQALPTRDGTFPVATLVINLAGAFALGLLLDFLAQSRQEATASRLRLLAGTGFLGAFTTYSTFAVESVQLVRTAHTLVALAYVMASAVGGLVAAWAGIRAGRPAGRLALRTTPVDPDIEADQ